MSASAIQLISVGWSDGRMPVVERMESPFVFFDGCSESDGDDDELLVLSVAER